MDLFESTLENSHRLMTKVVKPRDMYFWYVCKLIINDLKRIYLK